MVLKPNELSEPTTLSPSIGSCPPYHSATTNPFGVSTRKQSQPETFFVTMPTSARADTALNPQVRPRQAKKVTPTLAWFLSCEFFAPLYEAAKANRMFA